jgi:hypothetical protein
MRKIGAVKVRMTHIKKHVESLEDTADLRDVNVKLLVLNFGP